MEMEIPEEFTGSSDHTLALKGKRAKRQRPFSSSIVAVTSSCSTFGGSGGGGDFYSPTSSPTSSYENSTTTEEDEDMANCLILLAQGGGSKQVDEENEGRIRKFMATTTTAKSGFYVYECKTCDRTFPSFQALGGHRASHKKPKAVLEEGKRVVVLPQQSGEEEIEGQSKKIIIPSFSFQVTAKKSPHINNKCKLHDCSICGAQFSSGQALGGHMRRHRVVPPHAQASTSMAESCEERESNKPRTILSLDLNLPAPPEDFDYHTGKQHMVFAAPAAVDCHY
ncbi:zinc finger protein ZAT5-like [Actinidia eriantha]|uniref:zinc finger protein ZAT5-like n=1 Tax=Actinidia eriantha TaxID=165200 RepID=UPI00258DAB46|nr:zinc finger protein ZAT5-like [Actinidia eriantha]